MQNLRRLHADDFDLQLTIAEVHDQIIEHGRQLRPAPAAAEPVLVEESQQSELAGDRANAEANEEHAAVHKLDAKTWQRATYLALFFALLLFFAFFYLVQTARRLNFPQAEVSSAPAAKTASPQNVSGNATGTATQAPVPSSPVVRVYTDLIPASYSLDDKDPQELKDGELTLDKLEPGRHSIKVTGKYANAAVSFDVSETNAPRVIGQPVASNVMAVAVSSEDGKGRLTTSAESPAVLLDGKPAGEPDTDGVPLDGLGKTDHDIQVSESKDRQRFVLTYTSAPSLTLYIKADPNAGTAVIMADQDEADVFINDKIYRRRTDKGQLRIPLKVGEYAIRIHKAGFIDPPPQTVQVKKAEESPVEFKLEAVPEIATLQVKGALAGTVVYVDKDVAASINADGNANISNIKPGEHTIELRRDQALTKRFERTFQNGEVVTLSGPDTALERVVVDAQTNQAAPAGPPAPEPAPVKDAVQVEGQQVRKGGGFIHYNTPKSPGHYSFQAQSRKGGLFKRGKLQWYAGYADADNYVLYTLDGKRATVKDVQAGKTTELSKTAFEFNPDDWVQVDMSVKANSIVARVKTPAGGWQELPPVGGLSRDLTQDKVGMYIPGSDEVAIANFRFSAR